MIDIRNIEMVTPDIQRQVVIDNNQKLKTISYVLFSLLVISIAIYAIKQLDNNSKEK